MATQTLDPIATINRDDTADPAPSIWSIVPDSATLQWSARKKYLMFIPVAATGSFADITGQVEMVDANPETASGRFEIAVASQNSGQAKRDAHLQAADFFDVANHPSMTFATTSITRATRGGNQYRVIGQLTAKGETRPVTLEGTFVIAPGGTQAHVTLRGSIKRQDFGMTWSVVPFMKLFDDIALDIEVDLRQS